jgi:hypothetical protein
MEQAWGIVMVLVAIGGLFGGYRVAAPATASRDRLLLLGWGLVAGMLLDSGVRLLLG